MSSNPVTIADDNPNFHLFTVDAALLRELGERLVGKPYVALAELVKNSYDADATEVSISFDNDSITVSDNGDGMSQSEFISYWLRVGTTHKQNQIVTHRNRTVTGSKGVGRLSVQFLGDELEVVSRSKNSHEQFVANVHWGSARESGDLVKAGALVVPQPDPVKIDGQYEFGTSVKIIGLKQSWSSEDLRDLARELWFLKPPEDLVGHQIPDAFDIKVQGLDEDAVSSFTKQMNQALENWIAIIEGELENGKSSGSNNVTVRFRNGDKYQARYEPSQRLLDEVKFKIYVFKLSGKQTGGVNVGDARGYFKKFGGIHIYDNGFRLPFYGGDEQDWLDLEIDHSHRLNRSKLLPQNLQVASGLNDLPTNGRIFGAVNISTSHERASAKSADLERGKYLNVQVTRDRLIDNDAFAELQRSVRWAIDFYAMRSFERRQKMIAATRLEIPKVEEKVSEIRNQLFNISLKAPESLVSDIEVVSGKLKELEVLEDKKQIALNEERILLAALATTGMAALAMEHELHKELTVLNEIREQVRDGQHISDMPKLVKAIDNWAERTTRARKLFSPLMHEYDREKRNAYNARKVLARVVLNSEALLRQVQITNEIPSSIQLPDATFAAWNAIFQNVLINAVNAMIDTDQRHIFCSGGINGNQAFILVQDTGVGVRLHDSLDLFKPFIRRLEIPEERKSLGLGGMGIGLTIVKMVADSLSCVVSFVEPMPGYSTSFKIGWTV